MTNSEEWRYGDVWKSPAEFVGETLRSMRAKLPESLLEELPAESIPQDHIKGEEWSLDLEMLFFLVGGEDFVGMEKKSMMTPTQFTEALRVIHPDKVEAIDKLAENNFSSLRERIENNNRIFDQQRVEIERRWVKQLLGSWSPQRVEAFLLLSGQALDVNQLSLMRSLFDAMTNNVDNTAYEELKPTIEQYLEMASPLFCLTPVEMEEVSKKEKYYGFAYLDSLMSIREGLKETYPEAMRVERDLVINGAAEHQRELFSARLAVMNSLVYGAETEAVTRSSAERLFNIGREAPNNPENYVGPT